MKCSSCTSGELTPVVLEKTLHSLQCNNCGGRWIKLDKYLEWQKTQIAKESVVEEISVEVETVDSKAALLCPETGAIMTKFHITSDTTHRVDWSTAAGAIWLDKGEWELLVAKGVDDKLNQIFTDQWQKKIIQETAHNNKEARYIGQLGEETYSRLKLVRTWLYEQNDEDKAIMAAFLLAKDPFSSK